eukprot:XP_015580526.1 calcium-dependent protein kinase 34 isoform X2 [Ricinus communis]
MAVAKCNSSYNLLKQPCTCYTISSLTQTILDTNQTSNLKDRYLLGEQLGWGQFGVIRVCTDKFSGDLFACKSIAKDRLVTSDDARSVKLEIEIMTRLSGHPNVVDLKAVYEDEDYIHLVMELCAGGELFHQLEKHGRFSETEARVLFRHMMQVVLYCHEIGVVHRDLKPENILLATKASSSQIKLADFGLATYIKPGQSLHGTVGSPFYIAPEVLAGGYNQAADIWSAGVILYILLSGMPPFWGKTKSQIFDAVRAADLRFPSNPWDRVTESAKELVRGMLCTDPSLRLTAQQVLDHSWMKDDGQCSEAPDQCQKKSCGGWDLETSTPCFVSGLFSFRNSDDSNALEFSSPISSIPSFAFFSPGPVTEQGSCTLDLPNKKSSIIPIHGEVSLEKMLVLPKSSLFCGPEARQIQHKQAEVKRSWGAIGSRMGVHSKRNRTIGLGEHEQLDLVVTESVIRWASCTHLPSAPSLRSSLVC